MINKVIIIGNLGGDPEIRHTQNGNQVANFSVATTERWRRQDGQMQEQTEWHRVVAWDKLAEICGQYLAKGSKVYIEGKLQTRKWEDSRDNTTRYMTEIVAREMKMLDGKAAGDARQTPAQRQVQRDVEQARQQRLYRGGNGLPHNPPGAADNDEVPF